MNHKKYSFASGHSALSDKSAILRSDFRLRTSSARPQSSLESPDFSSQILECQAESSLKDSVGISESPAPKSPQNLQSNTAKQGEAAVSLVNTRIVCGEIQDSKEFSESTTSDSMSVVASNAKQSTESTPHANLESQADSELTPAVGHCPTAIKSHSGDKRSVSPTLEALSGVSGISANGLQGGRERPRLICKCGFRLRLHQAPPPLTKEKTTIEEVRKSLEAKAKDFEKADSESEKLKGRDISAFTKPQYDNDLDSDKQTESAPLQNLQSPADSITATKSLPKNLMDSTRQDTPFQILGVALLLYGLLRDFGAGASTISKHPKTSQIPQRQLSILRFAMRKQACAVSKSGLASE